MTGFAAAIAEGYPVGAPRSSMEAWDGVEAAARASALHAKFGTRLDRESAAEELARRVEAERESEPARASPRAPARRWTTTRRKAKQRSGHLTDFLSSRQGKALQREVVRGMLGLLRKRL